MPLTNLFSKLKGGSGSGHHGHSGIKGKRGGSSPKGGLPSNPTSKEYSGLRLFEEENIRVSKPVYVRESQLPPVPEGHVRVYHGTSLRNLESIDQRGVLSGKDIDKKERLNVVLGVAGTTSGFGEVSVIADLPKNRVHFVNDEWVEIKGGIPVSDIKGYMIGDISTSDVPKLVKIYEEYDKKYGRT